MTGSGFERSSKDPYRRHELRYWDGMAWTGSASDVRLLGDEPVFPVVDADPHSYLASPSRRRRRRLPGLDRAAAWAVSGFFGVVGLAVASAMGATPAPSTPSVATVKAAAADVAPAPAVPGAVAPGAARTATALALLEALPTRPADPAGTPWLWHTSWDDADRDGCDVRQDVLGRDLDRIRFEPGGCAVTNGVLRDPWTGASVGYDATAPTGRTGVRVITVVAPGAAWRTGSGRLSAAARHALANDPLNLVAVAGRTADTRGDSDASAWLPTSRAARCDYVARQIAVKAGHRLWVTAAERTAMRAVLTACPSQRVPTAAAR